ncbi:MAG TPA: glycosyltransferase family 39 protein [Baekduia sp.]|nr:glycosyltransferase family 39 protein [Baekduia sp.]
MQITAIVVLGGVTALRFHIWAEIDERQHYVNVQAIAEDGRYPLQADLVSTEVQAITDRTYPRPSPNDPRSQGLAGRSYEAVQPPLYYLLAAPAFLAPVDHRDKVIVLRLFDLVVLMATLALAAALCREVLGPRWHAGYAAVLATVLWPGVLVRMITISNDVLALPAGLLVALLTMLAWRRRSPRWLLFAGVALGAALLTKATLVFMVPVLLVTAANALRSQVVPRARPAAVLAIVIPLVMVTPWIVANDVRYGSLGLIGSSPDVLALYPPDAGVGTDGVLSRVERLTVASLPQEFSYKYESLMIGGAIMRGLVVALVAFGVGAALVARRRLDASSYVVLGLPLVAGVTGLIVKFERTGADAFFGRYLYASAVLFALFGAAGWIAAGRSRVAVGWAVVVSVVAAVFWVRLAGDFYFLDAGRTLDHAISLAISW